MAFSRCKTTAISVRALIILGSISVAGTPRSAVGALLPPAPSVAFPHSHDAHVAGRNQVYATTKRPESTVDTNPREALYQFAKDHLAWLCGLIVLPAAEFMRRRFPRRPYEDVSKVVLVEKQIPVITETLEKVGKSTVR